MITGGHRFHGLGSLRRVYKDGRTVRATSASLRYKARPADKPYRLAVVVSRKVSKSAVKRNRIRRRVYEIVRQSAEVPKETDLIITVFDEKLADVPAKDLSTLINGLLKKAKP